MRVVPDEDQAESYHSRTPVASAREAARLATRMSAEYEACHATSEPSEAARETETVEENTE